ncbi:MAG: hypothetical protein Q3999_00030 [Buchananella hordeovulneris]|nr:hypothetical protein [Buchananella hordeovulneris]
MLDTAADPQVPPVAQVPPGPHPPAASAAPQIPHLIPAQAGQATPTFAGQATPTAAANVPAPAGEDYAYYQAPLSSGQIVDTGWVVTKGKSSSRLQREWHMTVSREIPIPEGLKWLPTAWKWSFYLLMTTVIALSLYYGIIQKL